MLKFRSKNRLESPCPHAGFSARNRTGKGDENITGKAEKPAAVEARMAELQVRIADLKRRMPAHTPRASMIRELEELEEELDRLRS